MISCTEFIPAYSELFKFLEARGGREAVEDFWEYLSDHFLGNLRSEVQQHGLRGCWNYWSHTLNEEAAAFSMELDEQRGYFQIVMHRCPSMRQLLELDHIEPYHDYCRHCDVLYRRVLEPLGYQYTIDLSRCREATCVLTVKSLSENPRGRALFAESSEQNVPVPVSSKSFRTGSKRGPEETGS